MLLHSQINWGSLNYTDVCLPSVMIKLQWGESWAAGFFKTLQVILSCRRVWEPLARALKRANNKKVQAKVNLENQFRDLILSPRPGFASSGMLIMSALSLEACGPHRLSQFQVPIQAGQHPVQKKRGEGIICFHASY